MIHHSMKSPHTAPATLRIERPEIPNDETLAAMAAAEEYLKSGDRKVYTTVDEIMDALR
jgi:hypothetical protein